MNDRIHELKKSRQTSTYWWDFQNLNVLVGLPKSHQKSELNFFKYVEKLFLNTEFRKGHKRCRLILHCGVHNALYACTASIQRTNRLINLTGYPNDVPT